MNFKFNHFDSPCAISIIKSGSVAMVIAGSVQIMLSVHNQEWGVWSGQIIRPGGHVSGQRFLHIEESGYMWV